jgi:hypothetical protein
MEHKHHLPADDLRVPEYSRPSKTGLAITTGLALVALVAMVMLAM